MTNSFYFFVYKETAKKIQNLNHTEILCLKKTTTKKQQQKTTIIVKNLHIEIVSRIKNV